MPEEAYKEKLEKDKKEELIKAPPAVELKKKLLDPDFGDQRIEIKQLSIDDFDDVVLIMRKAMFEINSSVKEEVKNILKLNYSYGAYFERLLIAVALAWPVPFDDVLKEIRGEEANAMYIEDIAVLISYEGKGIREMLISEIEKRAKSDGFTYVVSIVGPNPKEGTDIIDMINNRGSRSERSYLSLGYKFIRSSDGLIAFKKIN